MLVNGYMYSGYTYESGETWLPPLKRAVVDASGHLRLGYWKGNEILQGVALNVDLAIARRSIRSEAKTRLFLQRGGQPAGHPGPTRTEFDRPDGTSRPRLPSWTARSTASRASS